MSREQTKGARYIQQLDEARCQGNWDEVPELVRKIKKHAPGRSCLTLTAEAEHAVIKSSHTWPSIAQPSAARTVATSTVPIAISKYIPLLLEAIQKERTFVEDDFHAQVCLGWIHWQLGEPALAAARLPKSIEEGFSQLDGTDKESAQWTTVCALKASYIKGSAQSRIGLVAEAVETFESALPILSSVSSSQKQGKELKSWTELFLTGFCMVSSLAIKSKVTSILESETLSAFRAWARFWENQNLAPLGGRAPLAEVPRRHIWREYYITLSDLLQQEIPFPTTSLAIAHTQASTRLQQRAELKGVEAKYETLLLSEVQFPKAEETNLEVESFVEIVAQNWRILCGSKWQEDDLGEGGADAVGRGVLDILYRAATKTFHSTPILRHLFTVHLAVAEFELAFKAFDTYIEIVKKGKARVEKTGEEEPGLDDDETVLKTVSECIKALCRYGGYPGAEKAKDLGQFFEDWLNKFYPTNGGSDLRPENRNSTSLGTVIASRTFALVWRCIGIGHAQWARVTYDASARGEMQLRAIKCFRNALLPQYESTTDIETLFALGMILAERRELSAAIDVVKSGLLPHQSTTVPSGLVPQPRRFSRERSLIPLWHLMALLLSARQEFVTAARSCEGAFEQFQDPRNLFGDADLSGAFRSEHLNLNEKAAARKDGVVDEMDYFEKESVLEVKMTQLALIEVLEGPEVAVNASDELLSLYSRLFEDPKAGQGPTVAPTTSSAAAPPRSSAGTMKSIKGSIFGRSNRSTKKSQAAPSPGEKLSTTLRPQTAQTTATTRAPMIQVTNENGSTQNKHHHHLVKDHGIHDSEKLHKSESMLRKKGGVRNRSTSTGRRVATNMDTVTTLDGEKFFTPPVDSQHREQWLNDARDGEEVGIAISPDHSSDTTSNKGPSPKSSKSHPMLHKEISSKPADSDHVIAHISPSLSSANPVTRFPQDQEKRRRMTMLVKVWLLISGFYRRAALYNDSKGAIDEAHKLVESMDLDTSKDTSGSISVSHPGWGGGKSVAELWGDIHSERGALAVANSSPYVALAQFESALNNFADHPAAIVGLSKILLDIYSEDLLPATSIPPFIPSDTSTTHSASTLNTSTTPATTQSSNPAPPLKLGPIGLPTTNTLPAVQSLDPSLSESSTPTTVSSNLSPSTSNKESSTALLDRLAARDRAYGLLSGLTKLGTGWNYSEAWFTLARAYELGGQADKAREVLWWCVELEEGRAVRLWEDLGRGYVL